MFELLIDSSSKIVSRGVDGEELPESGRIEYFLGSATGALAAEVENITLNRC